MQRIKLLMAEDVKGIDAGIFDLRLVENGQEAWDEYITKKPVLNLKEL